jgi:hypothetical protein
MGIVLGATQGCIIGRLVSEPVYRIFPVVPCARTLATEPYQ